MGGRPRTDHRLRRVLPAASFSRRPARHTCEDTRSRILTSYLQGMPPSLAPMHADFAFRGGPIALIDGGLVALGAWCVELAILRRQNHLRIRKWRGLSTYASSKRTLRQSFQFHSVAFSHSKSRLIPAALVCCKATKRHTTPRREELASDAMMRVVTGNATANLKPLKPQSKPKIRPNQTV